MEKPAPALIQPWLIWRDLRHLLAAKRDLSLSIVMLTGDEQAEYDSLRNHFKGLSQRDRRNEVLAVFIDSLAHVEAFLVRHDNRNSIRRCAFDMYGLGHSGLPVNPDSPAIVTCGLRSSINGLLSLVAHMIVPHRDGVCD
jgi:hypothetical protein